MVFLINFLKGFENHSSASIENINKSSECSEDYNGFFPPFEFQTLYTKFLCDFGVWMYTLKIAYRTKYEKMLPKISS